MTIFRVVHKNNYTCVNNFINTDNRISFRAKGIWLYAFSRPDNWVFRLNDLISQTPDGRDAIKAALSELEKAGYLARIQSRNDNGKFSQSEWQFFEKPQNSQIILPQTEKPLTEKPQTAKRPLISNDILVSNENNKYTPPSSPFVRSSSSNQKQQQSPESEKVESLRDLKQEILAKYNLRQQDQTGLEKIPVVQVENACKAFDQYIESRKKAGEIVANPTAVLLNAIRGSWLPNLTKVDIDVAKQEKRDKIEDLVARNRIHVRNAGYHVKDTDYCVFIWMGSKHGVLELNLDEDFIIKILKQYPPRD